jgi:tetratricopeptide (TPR) repeat protein
MINMTKFNFRRGIPRSAWTIFALFTAAAGLYGWYLWNPVVFDDISFFDGSVHDLYLSRFIPFSPRWLPYATFEWTRVVLGLDLIWFRLGNLAIHLASTITLYFFFRRLLPVVHPGDIGTVKAGNQFSHSSQALICALLFAMHPVATYAVAYLVQRTTLMATFFMLLMAFAFLEGLLRRNQLLLLASALAYLLAATCKEHAIMAPAVMAALLLLVARPSKKLIFAVLPTFLLYGAVAVYVFMQIRSGHIVGQSYEPEAADLLSRFHARYPQFDPALAYPLSILTQATLFFKYLLLWALPNPAWMSVDMRESFALTLGSLYYLAGFMAFLLYGGAATWLLLSRGRFALLGFAMISPWLMFATEFAAVRIQEPFVLYRSYLWMPFAFLILPVILQWSRAKPAALVLAVVAVLYVPCTLDRLQSFSHGLLLWDDAARLIGPEDNRPGTERIFHNRGVMLARVKLYDQAIQDYDRAIRTNPDYAYFYNDRAAAWLESGHPETALADYNRAIQMNQTYSRPFYGRGRTEEALGNREAAVRDYTKACLIGAPVACSRLVALTGAQTVPKVSKSD